MFSTMTRRLRQSHHRHRHGHGHGRYADSPSGVVPLTEVSERTPLCLMRVGAPCNPEVQRLCELGLTTGCRLLVVKNGSAGSPIVVLVGDCRLCLNREVARHLWVKVVPAT
jgi:Fe2+ transport system protein FeoA